MKERKVRKMRRGRKEKKSRRRLTRLKTPTMCPLRRKTSQMIMNSMTKTKRTTCPMKRRRERRRKAKAEFQQWIPPRCPYLARSPPPLFQTSNSTGHRALHLPGHQMNG